MSNFKWEFSHIIEESHCFKNNVHESKVIMGLSGNGDVLATVYIIKGNCVKGETIKFDNATGKLSFIVSQLFYAGVGNRRP